MSDESIINLLDEIKAGLRRYSASEKEYIFNTLTEVKNTREQGTKDFNEAKRYLVLGWFVASLCSETPLSPIDEKASLC